MYKIATTGTGMAEGRTDGITEANEEWNDLPEQQTEIEALQGTATMNLSA